MWTRCKKRLHESQEVVKEGKGKVGYWNSSTLYVLIDLFGMSTVDEK